MFLFSDDYLVEIEPLLMAVETMTTESMNDLSVRTENSVKHWNLNLHAKLPQEISQHKDLQRNLLWKAPPPPQV